MTISAASATSPKIAKHQKGLRKSYKYETKRGHNTKRENDLEVVPTVAEPIQTYKNKS